MIQVLSPVSLAVASITHTINLSESHKTVDGLQGVMESGDIDRYPSLPSLGSDKVKNTSEESGQTPELNSIAAGASRSGQLLSSDNTNQATINYARGIAEGLINDEINNWLNQKGTGRVSVGSDKTFSGDVLLPVIDTDDSLFFTQGGIRSKEDRNTVNIGMGYRQYAGDWMYGVNSFWDHDYTGKNSRLGIGSELWTDYLKLSANGYFRLTNWHESRISAMRDYDERPANGFDVRAEAWLPSWPQLGGNLKYEQYFGKGVDFGTGSVSPDKLKNNPKAVTAGLTYTPFPLLSFSGERSIGDRNQTKVGIDLNYRFGVSLAQQLNPATLDMMRSLVGNRHDLVDRNYDIVMQYRKQDLLRISLPDVMNAQAAESITIPVKVQKSKYGVKDTEWIPSSEFLTNGGSFRKTSTTQIEVHLPAYVYTTRNGAPQEYTFKATSTDNNGNRSNTASTVIRVIPSKNVVSALVVSPAENIPANDSSFATVTATVTNESGAALAEQNLTFSINGIIDAQNASGATLFTGSQSDSKAIVVTTDGNGQAVAMVRSKLAKTGNVAVTMDNGNSKSASVSFVADKASAQVISLKVIKDNAVADGISADELEAVVHDANGNPIEGVSVNADVDHDGIIDTTGKSDISGRAVLKVTNETAGLAHVSVQPGDIAARAGLLTADINFVADLSTVQILSGDMVATEGAIANGKENNAVSVKVTDARGHVIEGAQVAFSADTGIVFTPASARSDANGKVDSVVTSLKAGTYNLVASLPESGNSAQSATSFVADGSTAVITDSNLIIEPDGNVADGTATNGVTAIVTDGQGNLVSGAAVSFSVENGAEIRTLTGMTGADGKATAEVSSAVAGTYQVTATVNDQSTRKPTSFVADGSTAQITQSNLTIDPDGAVADGTTPNGVTAIVTDAKGNRVAGVTVNFTVDNGATIRTLTGTTGAEGKATAEITSIVSGTYMVTATVNGNATSKPTTFVADSSTAEITESHLTIDSDGNVANGSAANGVTAIVTDGQGNLVSGAAVNFTVAEGAAITTLVGTTDVNGKATAEVTSTKAGTYSVTATINDKVTSKPTTFIADSGTAQISETNLTIHPDGNFADGEATNGVVAIVTDALGNLVPGAVVSFTVANGAEIRTLTGTTGPDGKAIAEVTSSTAGSYMVTATVNGRSASKLTTFVADSGTAQITDANLTIYPDGNAANGSATNGVTATVTDAQGNLVSGATVSFTVTDNAKITTLTGTTGADGKATAEVTSRIAGTYTVTAMVNGKNTSKPTTFVADGSTAEITDANLVVAPDGNVANGSATNGVTATVTDAQGNLVAGAAVSFTVTDDATITTLVGTTGADGKATAEVTSRIAGTYTVTATVNGKNASKPTTFVADGATAEITDANLVIAPDGNAANGSATNGVTATVTDAQGNLVAGAAVSFTVTDDATITTLTGITGADGKATAEVTSRIAGTYTVTATLNGKNASKPTTFVADGSTAEITDANLVIAPDGNVANGSATNGVTATVTDAQGNLVSGAAVSFTVTDDAAIVTLTGTTGADGKATAEVTSRIAGTYTVTATVNGKNASKPTTFVADSTTAEITDANLVIAPDGSAANGSATNGVTATVTDVQGNLVAGTAVSFTVSDDATITTLVGTTGADGKATAEVTSRIAGTYTVTATVNGKNASKPTTFVADGATAEIADANLVIAPDGSAADGKSTNGVIATVTDAQGNLVSGAAVSFTVTDDATITTLVGMTGANGKATAEVTSRIAGTYTVTATVNGKNVSKPTIFVADDSSAEITEANLVIAPDGSAANGAATNGVTATVTDAQGNLVSGAAVSFTVTDDAEITTLVGTTGADGKATAEVTSRIAGTYTVTATVNGKNVSKPTTFVADSTTAEIAEANLVIAPDGSAADGKSTNGVTATVTDAQGNLVSGAAVSFTVTDDAIITTLTGTTGADGKATAEVTATLAGTYTVTAAVNSKNTSKPTTFVADATTAEITEANLVIDPDGATADGAATNGVTATVTDAQGNLVSGVAVNFTVTDDANIVTLTGTTGADGKATAEVTSRIAGTYTVTATVNGKNASKPTTFVADGATAEVTEANLVIDPDGAIADGVATNGVTATVTDAQGNLVSGATVSFTVTDDATITTLTGTTGADGKATAEVTSRIAGTYTVTATVNGNNASKPTTFVADGATAEVTEANLVIDPDGAAADGVTTNGVTATVTDAQGNLVSGATVSFTVTDDATITTLVGTTGADGKATAEVTSRIAGTYTVTATVNGKNASKPTTFVADGSTAEITQANLVIDPDGAIADGVTTNDVTATVTDAEGNLVSGAEVNFILTVDGTIVTSGAEITTLIGITGTDGKATAEVTGTVAGTYSVVAEVNGKAVTKPTTFVPDASTAFIPEIGMILAPASAAADGVATIAVTAEVDDAQWNLVPGAVVTFTVTGGAKIETLVGTTGADGKARAEVTSIIAGIYTVTASVNGNSASKKAWFYADTTTAEITDANLTMSPNNTSANGISKNGVRAEVTDANGNPIYDAEVSFTVAEGAEIVTINGTTHSGEPATAEITSTTAGSYLVTATVNGKAFSKLTTFKADASTGEIVDANFIIDPDGSVADGISTNGVTVTVTDAQGNLIPDEVVTFTVTGDAKITTLVGTTGADGKATAEVTATQAGTYTVTARMMNGKTASKATTFVADSSTAEITEANLVIDPDGAVADGVATNGVTATVTDAQGNLVSGAAVSFTVADDATITTLVGTTGADGKATAEITSRIAATYTVTATVNGKNVSKPTLFVADNSTAEVTEANLVIDPDGAIADGVATNGVTAIVTDAQGNLVSGAAVSFTVADGAKITTLVGTTGADGKATAEITSVTAGSYMVTATMNGKETKRQTTFIALTGIKGVLVNGETFSLASGFPTTGFINAQFSFVGDDLGSYEWSSNVDWISVTDGVARFTKKPASGVATITAKLKNDPSQEVLTYKLNVRKWFTDTDVHTNKISETLESNACQEYPEVEDLNHSITSSVKRMIGNLHGEWGAMSKFGFALKDYATTTVADDGAVYLGRYFVNVYSASPLIARVTEGTSGGGNSRYYALCLNNL